MKFTKNRCDRNERLAKLIISVVGVEVYGDGCGIFKFFGLAMHAQGCSGVKKLLVVVSNENKFYLCSTAKFAVPHGQHNRHKSRDYEAQRLDAGTALQGADEKQLLERFSR